MTLHVLASIRPQPIHQADVAAALKTLVAASRTEPGNRRYDLFGPADGSDGFHLIEVYADQAALDAHRDSAHYKAFRAAIGAWLAEPPDVKVLAALNVAAR